MSRARRRRCPLDLLAVTLLVGCSAQQSAAFREQAGSACIEECKAHLAKGEDLERGPCLSDALAGGVVAPDTVCDVAHEPRQDVDDDRKNQCDAYHDGRASHFVEVDPACAFIQVK